MKKSISLLLISAMLLTLSSCGIAGFASIGYPESEIYSAADIEAAMDAVKDHFREDLFACVLLDLSYRGDESLEDFQDYLERDDADEVIVLYSDFYVSAISNYPGFDTHHTYENFNWILTRDAGEDWQITDCGY